jgi:predicted nucleotidyltransferase
MTETIGLTEEDLRQVRAVLRDRSEVDEAILFGSRAKGTHHPGSDVDVALKGDRVDFQTVLSISRQLNGESPMPYRFDILDLKAVTSPELLDHIARVGVTIYSKNQCE